MGREGEEGQEQDGWQCEQHKGSSINSMRWDARDRAKWRSATAVVARVYYKVTHEFGLYLSTF